MRPQVKVYPVWVVFELFWVPILAPQDVPGRPFGLPVAHWRKQTGTQNTSKTRYTRYTLILNCLGFHFGTPGQPWRSIWIASGPWEGANKNPNHIKNKVYRVYLDSGGTCGGSRAIINSPGNHNYSEVGNLGGRDCKIDCERVPSLQCFLTKP